MQESTARTDIDDESTEKVASPETLNVTSPRSVVGAIQSKTQEPEVVLELC